MYYCTNVHNILCVLNVYTQYILCTLFYFSVPPPFLFLFLTSLLSLLLHSLYSLHFPFLSPPPPPPPLPPPVPEGVPQPSVTATGIRNQLLVAWQPPSQPNGVILLYYIERALKDSENFTRLANVSGSSFFFFADLTARPFTEYDYRIVAVNSVGASAGPVTSVLSPEAGETSRHSKQAFLLHTSCFAASSCKGRRSLRDLHHIAGNLSKFQHVCVTISPYLCNNFTMFV